MICLYCGKTFASTRLNARYCPGGTCKENARKQRNATPPKDRNKTGAGRYIKVCAHCGNEFQSGSPRARYCPGGACKQAAYRERKERATT